MDGELNTKSMMTIAGGAGVHAGELGGAGRASRRKCLLYEQLVKVLISGVFPRAASLYVAAALKLLIINSPQGPKLILYSHKALMQRKVGANGTLGKQTSGERGQPDADAVIDRTEDRHTDTRGGGAEGEDQNENKANARYASSPKGS